MRFLHRFVRKAAKLLGLDASSTQVRRSFQDLLAEIRHAVERYPESQREAALKHMLSTARHFGSKLFTHYDHPDLPPTDNDLEGSFRLARRHERLITGHKSTARHVVRDGPFLLSALERARRGKLPSVEDLARVPDKAWRDRLHQIEAARAHYDRPRQLRVNLTDDLQEIVKRLKELRRSRAP